jgi:hypothetical protein
MGWFRPLVLAVLAAGACVKSNSTDCSGLVCPENLVCANDMCVDHNLLVACEGKSEGAACSLGEGGDGSCQQNLCIVGRCGDGVINGVEACDGIALAGKTCADFGGSGDLACTADCMYDMTGCSSFCGNGHVDEGEDCDGSDFNNLSCTDFGFYSGTLSCTSTCKANLGMCSGKCGDGQINGFEQCDGTNLNGQTCTGLGYPGMTEPLACNPQCAFAASSCSCGGMRCLPGHTCVVNGGVASCQ